MAHPFLARVARGPVLADGAMGTMLYARGVAYERCFDELNVSEPDLVQGIHREYIDAGAELIETNTFGANRIWRATATPSCCTTRCRGWSCRRTCGSGCGRPSSGES